jgi:hypothetical protein
MELGYKAELFHWNKLDLRGKSHQGGPRQATSTEYIVVVFKHELSTDRSLVKHYSLLLQKSQLVRFT